MNRTLTIEPLSGSLSPNEEQPIISPTRTRFETAAGPARNAIPIRCLPWKLDELFEAFIALLSVVYLIGAVGFGGLLLFYTLGR